MLRTGLARRPRALRTVWSAHASLLAALALLVACGSDPASTDDEAPDGLSTVDAIDVIAPDAVVLDTTSGTDVDAAVPDDAADAADAAVCVRRKAGVRGNGSGVVRRARVCHESGCCVDGSGLGAGVVSMTDRIYAVTSASGGLVLPMTWNLSHTLFVEPGTVDRLRARLAFVAGWK